VADGRGSKISMAVIYDDSPVYKYDFVNSDICSETGVDS